MPVTLSAVVAGFAAQLRQPKPLPGETLAQLVIRNHPQEWGNCVERIGSKFNLPKQTINHLRAARLDVTDKGVQHEIEVFVNRRIPTYWRTLESLAKLRQSMADAPARQVDLVEILWPRLGPLEGSPVEKLAEGMGATILPQPASGPSELDLAHLLPHLHSDFVWLVPGGTYFHAELTFMQLGRVLLHLNGSPRLALYSDNASSAIYRTAPLRKLAAPGHPLPANPREVGRLLQEAGYELAGDHDPACTLCKLEREYGGSSPDRGSTSGDPRPWWRKLLGI
jgi:hypothetical protein